MYNSKRLDSRKLEKMIEDFFIKEEAIIKCKTVEELFSSNSCFDSVEDYSQIIRMISMFSENLVEPFIMEMINRGNTDVIGQNINAMGMGENWKIAKKIPEFRETFFANFEKALEDKIGIDAMLTDIENEEIDIRIREDAKNLITNNWQMISKGSSAIDRLQLIRILKSSEEGEKIFSENLPTIFWGLKSSRSFFMESALRENLISREQMTQLILEDPTRILSESFEVEKDTFNSYEFMETLEKIDELLETTPNVDPTQKHNARENIGEYLSQNFEQILERIKGKSEEKGYRIEDLKLLKSWDTDDHSISKKFAENYDEIYANTQSQDIMDFIHLYSDVDVNLENIDIATIMKQTFPNIKDENLQWALSRMASELLEDQNIGLQDIEIYGKGHYSRSIKIGNYIFKVGENRATSEIPYDERIVQPLTRRKLQGENEEEVYVEVQNLVDKDWYKGLSDEEVEEELYKIYAEMRNRGHRWTDVRKDNVGRLLRPNLSTFRINGDEIRPENTAIGFTSDEQNTEERNILQAGELVIIDTDFIFDADKKYSSSIASRHKEFERRYIDERAIQDAKNPAQTPPILRTAIEKSEKEITSGDMQKMSNLEEHRENSQAKENIQIQEEGTK